MIIIAHPKNRKSIGIYVTKKYPYTGKQLKKGIDKLFKMMWGKLSYEDQVEISGILEDELKMIDWGIDEGESE